MYGTGFPVTSHSSRTLPLDVSMVFVGILFHDGGAKIYKIFDIIPKLNNLTDVAPQERNLTPNSKFCRFTGRSSFICGHTRVVSLVNNLDTWDHQK